MKVTLYTPKDTLYIAATVVCVDAHLFTVHCYYIKCDHLLQAGRKG